MSSNTLAAETSPYLLQHRDNPVHWRPWGEDALAEAKRSNRPILLSVGYAACHWCHVMAHESFEDAAVAEVMNSLFVNVKVDREERPDVDAVYQAALAIMGEHGGWPLTMFLTPDGEPFWGGTYFPPTPRFGRPAFTDVLRQVAQVFHGQRERIEKNVEALRDGLSKLSAPQPGPGLAEDALVEAAGLALRMIDPIRGGTSGAPKFPQPVFFRLLWRGYLTTGAPMFREAVTLTLDALCKGGIYDHLGGGFARYSTDIDWLVPHFEKMLYDNALLVELLSEVWLTSGSALYRRRVEETIGWVTSDLRVTAGDGAVAFASAFDADSEGEEGKFYVWTRDEIEAVLGSDADAFCRAYDVRREGNWEEHTILNLSRTRDIGPVLADPTLARSREALLAHRGHRVAPGRDDKVLADWNGLMIAALVRAGTAFDRPEWIAAARSAYDFVCRHMHPDGRLRHVWCAGSVGRHPAILEDYANLARAALSLFEATGDESCLQRARDWVATADRHHWDNAAGGYFQSADDTRDLVARSKSISDNAVPAGNGTMVEVLARLWLATGDDAYRQRCEALVQLFSSDQPQYLVGVPGLVLGAELLRRPVQVVIAGDPADAATEVLRRVVFAAPLPHAVVRQQPPGATLPPEHPAAGKGPVNGRAAAYVCVGPTCSLPIVDAVALRDRLAAA